MRRTTRLRYKAMINDLIYIQSNLVVLNGASCSVVINTKTFFVSIQEEGLIRTNKICWYALSLRAAKVSARRWLSKHGASLVEEIRNKL